VYVNPVAVAIDTLIADAVVVDSMILLVPKLILRVFALDETKVPVVKLNPFKSNVPDVSVVITVAVAKDTAPPRLVVPDTLLIVSEGNEVLLLVVIVPVPTNVGVKVLYVPPLASVNPLRFSAVVPGLNTEVPKFNILNQLTVVNVSAILQEVKVIL
jgi:hypothetical protein